MAGVNGWQQEILLRLQERDALARGQADLIENCRLEGVGCAWIGNKLASVRVTVRALFLHITPFHRQETSGSDCPP